MIMNLIERKEKILEVRKFRGLIYDLPFCLSLKILSYFLVYFVPGWQEPDRWFFGLVNGRISFGPCNTLWRTNEEERWKINNEDFKREKYFFGRFCLDNQKKIFLIFPNVLACFECLDEKWFSKIPCSVGMVQHYFSIHLRFSYGHQRMKKYQWDRLKSFTKLDRVAFLDRTFYNLEENVKRNIRHLGISVLDVTKEGRKKFMEDVNKTDALSLTVYQDDNNNPLLKKVDLSLKKLQYLEVLSMTALIFNFTKCKNIRKIRFRSVIMNNFMMEELLKLEKLEDLLAIEISLDKYFYKIFFLKLKKLYISGNDIPMDHLKELKGNEEIEDKLNDKLVEMRKHGGGLGDDNKFPFFLLQKCSNLEKLNGCGLIDSSSWEDIQIYFPKLKDITVFVDSSVDRTVEIILEDVNRLCLSYSRRDDNEKFSIPKLTNLRKLVEFRVYSAGFDFKSVEELSMLNLKILHVFSGKFEENWIKIFTIPTLKVLSLGQVSLKGISDLQKKLNELKIAKLTGLLEFDISFSKDSQENLLQITKYVLPNLVRLENFKATTKYKNIFLDKRGKIGQVDFDEIARICPKLKWNKCRIGDVGNPSRGGNFLKIALLKRDILLKCGFQKKINVRPKEILLSIIDERKNKGEIYNGVIDAVHLELLEELGGKYQFFSIIQ